MESLFKYKCNEVGYTELVTVLKKYPLLITVPQLK